MSRRVISTLLGVFAVAAAIGACSYVAFAPLVPKRVVTVTGQTATMQVSSASLQESAGWPAVVALAVMVLVCAAPMVRRARMDFLMAAAAMALVVGATWSTVGVYLLAPAVLLLAAGLVAPSGRASETG